MGLFVLATSCSSFTNTSRDVADDRRDRRERRDGFDIGDYTSQRINNDRGFIDVSEEFSRFRGLGGKNFKGLLVEAVRRDDRRDGPGPGRDDRRDGPGWPGGPGGPGRDDRRDSDLVVTLDRDTLGRFRVEDTRERQFFYVDLNREVGDKFSGLNIQFNPRNSRVVNLTVLTNDERPWDRPLPPPMPPRFQDYGAMVKNSITGRTFFGKGFNPIEAEAAGKIQCQTQGNPQFCMMIKAEQLVFGETATFCSIKNDMTNTTFLGSATSRLEAEYMAIATCQNAGNHQFCNGNLMCSNGRINRGMATICMFKNFMTFRTFTAKGTNEVEAGYLANVSCQQAGNPNFCKLDRCDSVPDPR